MNTNVTATAQAASAPLDTDAGQSCTNDMVLRAPRTVADTGLPALFVAHLVLKSLLQNGKSSLGDLITRHCLTAAALEETIGFLDRKSVV